MAGDWIKIETTTPDKPEVFRMAEVLGLDPDAVLGKLVRLWVWVDQQTYDGNAATVTRALLDRLSNVTGFAEAAIEAGWLIDTPGGLVFPNFDRHNGQTAKQRALTARRAARHRAKKGNAPVVTSALPREEKRRVKKTYVESKDIDVVVAHYQSYHPRAKPGAAERREIAQRLKEGYTAEDLCEAVDGCHKTPHNQGANERGTKYLSLELIVRNSSNVARFIEAAKNPPGVAAGPGPNDPLPR